MPDIPDFSRPLKLELETVTPLLLGGFRAGGVPELRAAPFRGQVRYWLRAQAGRQLLGTGTPAVAAASISKGDAVSFLKNQEMRAMGSTDAGSPVSFRVSTSSNAPLKYGKRVILPHKPGSPQLPTILDGQRFRLELLKRPGLPTFPDVTLQALLLWLNVGGVGKRSRRGFGSLRVMNISAPDLPDPVAKLLGAQPVDSPSLADHIQAVLEYALGPVTRSATAHPVPAAIPTAATFPAFLPGCWLVWVGGRAYPDYYAALYDFWRNFLRSPAVFPGTLPAFGSINPRRASPFHLHIAHTQAGFHLVLTAFHAVPYSSTIWRNLHTLVNACHRAQGGVFFTG